MRMCTKGWLAPMTSKSPGARRGLGTCRALVGWDEPMVSSWGHVGNSGDVGGIPNKRPSVKWIRCGKITQVINQLWITAGQSCSICLFEWIHDCFFVPRVYTLRPANLRGSVTPKPRFHRCIVQPVRPTSFPSMRWSPPVPVRRSPWRKHQKNNGQSATMCEAFCLQQNHQEPTWPQWLGCLVASRSCRSCQNLWKWSTSWRCCDGFRELKI